MTRRKFLQTIMTVVPAAFAAGLALTKTVVPRRFLLAKPTAKYPGPLKPISNIASQSKWSG